MAKDLKDKAMLESTPKEDIVTATEVIEEIFNTPKIIKYKEKGEIKTIEVSRMSVQTLEKAILSFFKLIALVKNTPTAEGKNKLEFNFAGLSYFANSQDLSTLKEVVLTCINVSLDDFNKFPPTMVMKIIDKWLEINHDEVIGFAKSFLALKENLTKYVIDLNQILLPDKK